MAAELSGAAGNEIVDNALLERRHRVGLGIGLPEKSQDIGHFPPRLVRQLW